MENIEALEKRLWGAARSTPCELRTRFQRIFYAGNGAYLPASCL